MIIDDHASITAHSGDGIRGYNFGTGDVTITVEADATISGARYGVSSFAYDGGHISLTNYGSIAGGTDAIDVNYVDPASGNLVPVSSSTGTLDNHGDVIGAIAAYNTTFTNEADGDWSMSGTSTFSGASSIASAGTIEGNGGAIEVRSGSLSLTGIISGAVTFTIDAGATLELASGVSSAQIVMFGADTGVLKLDDPLDFHGTIAGISQPARPISFVSKASRPAILSTHRRPAPMTASITSPHSPLSIRRIRRP